MMVDYGEKSILIVHQENVSRWAIKSLIEQKWPDVHVVEAEKPQEGLALAKAEGVSLTLIHMTNTPVVTAEVVRALVDITAGAPVIVLGGSETADEAIDAVHAGAHAYISQRSDGHVLEHVITVVLGGGFCFPRMLKRSPVSGRPRQPEASSGHAGNATPPQARSAAGIGLTKQQLAVARLVAEGLSNKEIANYLGILEGTVKAHLRAVAATLGVRNRTQVALAIVQRGLLDGI